MPVLERKYLLFFFLLILTLRSTGQLDPIFTQYMFNTQAINPAYAGMWEKIGFLSLVRKQWAGIDNSPSTQMVSFHSPLKNETVGIGLNIINDRYALEKRLSIFGDYSFEVLVSPQTHLRLGLKFGFMHFQNPLTQYKLIDDKFDPAFQDDIDLKFLPNFGVGAFYYSQKYYISLSIPKLIENSFSTNRSNYSSLAEIRHLYLSAGYVFDLGTGTYVKFKPTMLLRATKSTPLQLDLSANFLIYEKLWLGAMLRTGDAGCLIVQWTFDNNMRIGYAMDFTFSEIYKHQNGTYEFTLSYDVDFYGRRYIRPKYF
jgi:type IX secretion system PorP/SprF family membrane protein